MVMEVVHEEGNMGCVNHQYKNSTPGGICAFCLQEKLGKLVSSSFPVAVLPSSSSSFRSDTLQGSLVLSTHPQFPNYIDTTSRSRLPFILTQKQKDKNMACSDSNSIIFERSMSTTTPRRRGAKLWSLLQLPKYSAHKTIAIHSKPLNSSSATPRTMCSSSSSRDKKNENFVVVDETDDGAPDEAALDRKVSKSRSIGCGSRSFSGDFFEKISTGFGDCTLRTVESQREAMPVTPSVRKFGVTERVKCGGIFSGFMTPSSSSSSSNEDKSISANHSSMMNLSHSRIRSWGRALASPMRAFGKQPSMGNSVAGSIKNFTPNSAGIPSLFAA